jgi:hypothetical protein
MLKFVFQTTDYVQNVQYLQWSSRFMGVVWYFHGEIVFSGHSLGWKESYFSPPQNKEADKHLTE